MEVLTTTKRVINSNINNSKLGIERQDCGKNRQMTNNPNKKGAMGTFEILKTNAVGDSYVDPGQYFLRSSTYTSKGEVRPKTSSQSRVFKPSGGHKLTKNSEFKHHHNGPPPKKDIEPMKNFLTRSTYELF